MRDIKKKILRRRIRRVNMGKDVLEDEIDFFMENCTEWLGEHDGKWVVIKGGERTGFWHSEMDALREGYERFGNTPSFTDR